MRKIAFRMDDIGASTKQFEVYSKSLIGNILFLKYIPPFKAWAPYRELNNNDWEEIIKILKKSDSKMTVAITACWVEKNGDLISFPEKFPTEAKAIKSGLDENVLEIANHGLTHCVVGKHLPKYFSSNRRFHREFYDFLAEEEIKKHLERSQLVLEDFFETKIVTFVPPGNVYTKFTKRYAKKIGLKFLSAKDENVFAFHDREIVKLGPGWLENKINEFKNQDYKVIAVKDSK